MRGDFNYFKNFFLYLLWEIGLRMGNSGYRMLALEPLCVYFGIVVLAVFLVRYVCSIYKFLLWEICCHFKVSHSLRHMRNWGSINSRFIILYLSCKDCWSWEESWIQNYILSEASLKVRIDPWLNCSEPMETGTEKLRPEKYFIMYHWNFWTLGPPQKRKIKKLSWSHGVNYWSGAHNLTTYTTMSDSTY